jgi:pantoate--beta-alanine ligase
MKVIHTVEEMREEAVRWLRQGQRVGLVPTMGAFHSGHLSLMHQARRDCRVAVVSIFVNPLQFSAGEDFDRYPRRLASDEKVASSEGVDVLFVPTVAEMYPKGFDTHVDQKDLPAKLCGPSRPGHFRGVTTVVTKLINIVRPTVVYMGQKDFQQYLIIRRAAIDLNLGTEIRLMPTVREEDGLAMSSRNEYLGPKQRRDATVLYQALSRARDLIKNSENSASRVMTEMKRIIRRVKGARIEYMAIVNQDTLDEIKEIKGRVLVALAVRIGKARLIDNIVIG